MVLILLLIIGLLSISIGLIYLGAEKSWEWVNATGVIGAFLSLVLVFVYSFSLYEYVAAGYKVDIINREFNTTYTQAEVFYASDVIDTIRELKRTRVELNGDLMLGKPE